MPAIAILFAGRFDMLRTGARSYGYATSTLQVNQSGFNSASCAASR